MEKSGFIVFAALSAAFAIAVGAFAAHGLDGGADAPRILWLKTGADYNLIHAVGLLAVSALGGQRFTSWCFAIGIIFFSGSLYLMALTGILWLGAIAPIGGLAFIIGWLALAWSYWRHS